MSSLRLTFATVGLVFVVLACDSAARREARQSLATKLKVQHSAEGKLSMLSPAEFKALPKEPGSKPPGDSETRTYEMAWGPDFSIGVGVYFQSGSQAVGRRLSKEAVEAMFEGLGKESRVEIQSMRVDGRPGFLVLTTALGFDKPKWMAMFFGPDSLYVGVEGHDDTPVTKEACELVIRSIKFD